MLGCAVPGCAMCCASQVCQCCAVLYAMLCAIDMIAEESTIVRT